MYQVPEVRIRESEFRIESCTTGVEIVGLAWAGSEVEPPRIIMPGWKLNRVFGFKTVHDGQYGCFV